MSFVAWFVCLHVDHTGALWINGRTDRHAIWRETAKDKCSGGLRKASYVAMRTEMGERSLKSRPEFETVSKISKPEIRGPIKVLQKRKLSGATLSEGFPVDEAGEAVQVRITCGQV